MSDEPSLLAKKTNDADLVITLPIMIGCSTYLISFRARDSSVLSIRTARMGMTPNFSVYVFA
jgi:hypothetical protein